MGDERFWTKTICLLWASLLAVLLILVFFGGGPAGASTVTFTDADGVETGTVPLPEDGHFAFRIKAADSKPTALPTKSVLVLDDTGQMAEGCYPIESGQTVAVTSELVVAAQPVVTVTGTSYGNADCTGPEAGPSNPITVRFVPEPSVLLGPLAP